MRLDLQYLPADALGLPDWARSALAGRPAPSVLPGTIVPDRLEALPRRPDAFDADERASLALALESSLAPFRPHVAVLDSIRAIARPGTQLVIAGQQPAFLGGPLLDVYKTLHAIRLARSLTALWEVPVVPVFWNHADDHDIAEVHHLWLQNSNLDLFKVGLAGVSSGRTPLSRIRYERERHRLDALASVLRQSLPEGPGLEAALALFLPRDGESFSNAFTRTMLELFGSHGLVVLEPDWLRESFSRALAHVVAVEVQPALERGVECLRAAGLEPAIDPREAALLWRTTDDRRLALRAASGEYRYDGESGSRTGIELAAEILQEPGAFSAGALLRPLVQDLALPTAAYVGGWGELHYHAQLPALRELAGVPPTPFVPRFSATLVDPETRAALERLGLTVAGALASAGAGASASEEPGESAPTSALGERLRHIAADAAQRLLAERDALAEVERGLVHQLKKASDSFAGLVDRVATKAERVQANALGSDRRHQRRIANALLPRGTPQERVRGAFEFVARFGTSWLDRLLEELDPLPTEHVIVNLVAEDSP